MCRPQLVMGLDQHRAQITAEWIDTVTGEVSRGRIVPADRSGVRKFLARFAGSELEVALEATTGWRFVVEELRRIGASVHLAEPAETSALRGNKQRAKNDRADARHLRELLMAGRLPECWIAPDHLLDLRARVRLRHTLVDERGEWQQRMQAVLYHHGLPKRAGLLTCENRAWIEQLPVADPSIPHRAICPNCRAHASSSRCPSPETRKCAEAKIPPPRQRPSRSTSACAGRPRPRCPHDRASSANATVPDRASSLASLENLHGCMLLADRPTTSRWTPSTGRTLLSGQADPRRQEPRPTLRAEDNPSPGVRSLSSQTSVQPSSLTRTVTHAGDRNSTPGSLWRHSDRPDSARSAPKRAIAFAQERASRPETADVWFATMGCVAIPRAA